MGRSRKDASPTGVAPTGGATTVAAQTQLLLDEPSFLKGALIIDAPPADVPLLSMAARHFSFFDDASLDSELLEHAIECGVAPSNGGETTVVLYLPKGARRRDFAFALGAKLIGPSGALLVVGERKGGIKGARSALRDAFETVQVRRVGHHCQLLQASGPKAGAVSLSKGTTLEVVTSQDTASEEMTSKDTTSKDAASSSESMLDAWEVRWDTGLGFEAVSLPGTFAGGRLDEGTARLLEVCGPRKAGRSLDLACGSGVIGVHLKRERPSDEWVLADADHLAVEASKRTAALAGVQGEVLASDAYAGVEGLFDCILANPPFHQGVGTDQSVPRRFVLGAPAKLSPRGELWLVANHFLPYEGWMREAFESVENAFEDSRFKVLVGRRPRGGVGAGERR